MKKTKKLLFTLIVTTAFFISTNVFAETSKSLTIVYNPNNGEKPNITEVCEGNTCDSVMTKLKSLQLPTPAREGYAFKGWFTDEALTKPVVDYSAASAPTVTVNSDITWNYYAKWEQGSGSTSTDDYELNAYLVLVIDEDTKKEIKICGPDNCSVGNTITENIKKINLPIPEKEGYKFEGWYLDDDYKVKVNDTKEFSKAIEKMKTTETGAVAEDDTSGVSMSISGSGNLEKQSEKISYKLYAKWTKDGKQVVKTGNTGMNSGMLFTIIGILMISAGSVVIYKKTRNNN